MQKKVDLEASGGVFATFGPPGRSQEGFTHKAVLRKVDFLVEIVAPRAHFGAQLGRNGVPKSHFFAKNQHKIVKKSIQERFSKKH